MTHRNRVTDVRIAQQNDIETLFDIRPSWLENHQLRQEIAELHYF